jgi:hypothetical protein
MVPLWARSGVGTIFFGNRQTSYGRGLKRKAPAALALHPGLGAFPELLPSHPLGWLLGSVRIKQAKPFAACCDEGLCLKWEGVGSVGELNR